MKYRIEGYLHTGSYVNSEWYSTEKEALNWTKRVYGLSKNWWVVKR